MKLYHIESIIIAGIIKDKVTKTRILIISMIMEDYGMADITVMYRACFGRGDYGPDSEYEVNVSDELYNLYQQIVEKGEDPNVSI